jgi:hypothetical protein
MIILMAIFLVPGFYGNFTGEGETDFVWGKDSDYNQPPGFTRFYVPEQSSSIPQVIMRPSHSDQVRGPCPVSASTFPKP